MSGDMLNLTVATPHRRQIEWVSNWLGDFPRPISVCSGNHDLERDSGVLAARHHQSARPEKADVERKRISILAPIGTALVGCRVGDIVNWSTPGGIRQLKVRRVVAPAPASAPVAAPAAHFAGVRTA
jgi:hypothetical protein